MDSGKRRGRPRAARIIWAFRLIVVLCLCYIGYLLVEKEKAAPLFYHVDSSQKAAGADERIQFLVLHYTAEDFTGSMKTLTTGQVSAHYLIPLHPDNAAGIPTALRLVDESRRAWHAGESYWRGRENLNDTSIGIEIENGGYYRTLTGYDAAPYPPHQIALVIALSRDIIKRYHISPFNVVGHSDIAWRRKQDPGPLFPWRQLAAAGVGIWPDQNRVHFYLGKRDPRQRVAMPAILQRMARYGYDVTPGMPVALQQKAVAAFQMHFRPTDFRGLPDAETEAILDALLEVDAREGGAR